MNWVLIVASWGDSEDAGWRVDSIRFNSHAAAEKAAVWLNSKDGILTFIVEDFPNAR